jgi:NAD(P)-dependent dehydrogenase (short-subunit alcohol dehydrogenase family)
MKVLVTGGASGIGAATCALLRKQGHTAYAADLPHTSCDVALDVAVEENWEKVLASIGHVDGLVNCAGVRTFGSILDISAEEFDRAVAVNLRGTFLGMKAVANRWIASGFENGRIVNVASVAGMVAMSDTPHYSAAKAGVIMLTKAAACELASRHVRVNAIAPGAIDTPMGRERLTTPAALAAAAGRTPQRRLGDPEEVADTIVYLLSDGASYIAGQLIAVDGGLSISLYGTQ